MEVQDVEIVIRAKIKGEYNLTAEQQNAILQELTPIIESVYKRYGLELSVD